MIKYKNIISGFLSIADGIFLVITLGNYHPGLEFKFMCWYILKQKTQWNVY